MQTVTPDARGKDSLSENAVTVEIAVSYYRQTKDGRELFEIDTERFSRRVNGVMFCPAWRQKYGFNFKQSYNGLRAVFFMEINMSFPGETRVIKLYSPVSFENGGLLEQVTLREPLVRDRIAFSKDRGSEEKKRRA